MSTGRELFEKALAAEGVSGKLADLSRSIYFQESGGGRNTKASNAGARGGMQIIPSTFNSVADRGWSIDDPEQNARAGIRYLRQLDKQAGGDPALTAAGYYGGPGGLEKARRGVAVADPLNPNAPNTLQYGAQVVARMGGGGGAKAPISPLAQPDSMVAAAPPPVSVEEAPVMLAQAQAPQAPAIQEASVVAPAPDAWQTFLQSMPQQPQHIAAMAPMDSMRAYGEQPMPLQIPNFQAAVPQYARPNFTAFGQWGSRARTA